MYHHRAEGEEEEYISQSSSTTPDFDAEEEEEEEADDDDDDDDDEESAMYGRFGKRERRIEHYTSSQRILLVGEGDFSFSLSRQSFFLCPQHGLHFYRHSAGSVQEIQ
jgi:hypothetical protein